MPSQWESTIFVGDVNGLVCTALASDGLRATSLSGRSSITIISMEDVVYRPFVLPIEHRVPGSEVDLVIFFFASAAQVVELSLVLIARWRSLGPAPDQDASAENSAVQSLDIGRINRFVASNESI